GILDASDDLTQALCQGHATTADPDQPQAVDSAIFLYDLIGQPYKCAFDLGRRHELRLLAKARLTRGHFGIHLLEAPAPRFIRARAFTLLNGALNVKHRTSDQQGKGDANAQTT